jgi:CBS domain-containing membrane protein
MNDVFRECAIAEEDLRAALSEIGGYVDVTIEDLMRVYVLALEHARARLSQKVPVSAVMSTNPISIGPDADLHAAARLLGENKVSGLPVVDDKRRVVGLISEADVLSMTGIQRTHTFRDVLRHVLGEPVPGRRQGTRVGDFMTSPAITITPDADIRDAARILDEKRIKRLPVIDDDHRLVGIISRADIVKVMGAR